MRQRAAAALSTNAAPTLASLTNAQVATKGDWQLADWETISGRYYARCLVGPGGTVTLAVGNCNVWVKVTDNPEVPIMPAGTLTIY